MARAWHEAHARALQRSVSRELPARHGCPQHLVQCELQHQQTVHQPCDKPQAEQHARPGIFLSVVHVVALLSLVERLPETPSHADADDVFVRLRLEEPGHADVADR